MTETSTDDIIAALERNGGNRLVAAGKLGLSLTELNRIIQEDERLTAALKAIHDKGLERVEQQLVAMAQAGSAPALKFLARYGKPRSTYDLTTNNEAINGSRKA